MEQEDISKAETQNAQEGVLKVDPHSAPPTVEPMLATAQLGHAQPGVHIRSKKTLFRVGLAVAIVNPVFSGLLIGAFFLREPELKREGKIILSTAIAWGACVLLLVLWNRQAG